MCGAEGAPRPLLPAMAESGGAAAAAPGAPAGLSASQRRAELRRRKLLMNSEERINRIMGFHRPAAGKGEPGGGWRRGAVRGSRPRGWRWGPAAAASGRSGSPQPPQGSGVAVAASPCAIFPFSDAASAARPSLHVERPRVKRACGQKRAGVGPRAGRCAAAAGRQAAGSLPVVVPPWEEGRGPPAVFTRWLPGFTAMCSVRLVSRLDNNPLLDVSVGKQNFLADS